MPTLWEYVIAKYRQHLTEQLVSNNFREVQVVFKMLRERIKRDLYQLKESVFFCGLDIFIESSQKSSFTKKCSL